MLLCNALLRSIKARKAATPNQSLNLQNRKSIQLFGVLFIVTVTLFGLGNSLGIAAETTTTTTIPETAPTTSVCIFQPITSRLAASSAQHSTVLVNATHSVPMMAFMASLEPTLEVNAFAYHLYLGFDFGDPLWDVAKTRNEFEAMFSHMPIRIHWIRLYGSGEQVTLAHNMITKTVYADGCEYIVFSNDDLVWHTKDWTSKAVAQLRNYLVPNFGMVAFADAASQNGRSFPTFHMTHRTHMDIIDEFSPVYCPITHRFAFCDPFMFDVYAPFGLAVLRGDIQIENFAGGNTKTRYNSETNMPDECKYYLRGRLRIAEKLKELGKLQDWMPSTRHVAAIYPITLWNHPLLHTNHLVPSPTIYFNTSSILV